MPFNYILLFSLPQSSKMRKSRQKIGVVDTKHWTCLLTELELEKKNPWGFNLPQSSKDTETKPHYFDIEEEHREYKERRRKKNKIRAFFWAYNKKTQNQNTERERESKTVTLNCPSLLPLKVRFRLAKTFSGENSIEPSATLWIFKPKGRSFPSP